PFLMPWFAAGTKKYQRAGFYKTLLNLRKNNSALAVDGSFKKLITGVDDKVYAHVREKNGNKVLVLLNISPDAFEIKLNGDSLKGNPLNVFPDKPENINPAASIRLKGWGYLV